MASTAAQHSPSTSSSTSSPAPSSLGALSSNAYSAATPTSSGTAVSAEGALSSLWQAEADLSSLYSAAGYSVTRPEAEMPTGVTDSETAASRNPLLAYQPAYVYSMPTQILVHGVILTLLCVLCIHLVFTARYHYPLAKLHFLLLLATTLLSLGCVAATISIVNLELLKRSRVWPFMLDYVEVTMPPDAWNEPQLVGYYFFQMLITLLTHVTHIQFLTLLFPSSLEKKLVLLFLAPLAILSSCLYFTKFFSDDDFVDLGDAIRNAANSTLTLLYTVGLIIWGGAVNRKRAWDTEGGTAGFGALAVVLALLGTATNFVEIKEDRMDWLPWIVWTVLLWQSWTGFWWWVGAGMWSGEVEDIEAREEKRRRREAKRLKKRERKLNLLLVARSGTLDSRDQRHKEKEERDKDGASVARWGQAITSGAEMFSRRLKLRRTASMRTTRTGGETGSTPGADAGAGEEIELRPVDVASRVDMHRVGSSVEGGSADAQRPGPSHEDTSSSSTPSYSTITNGFLSLLLRPRFVRRWISHLSAAHNAAAKQQAETAGERDEVEEVKRWGISAMKRRVDTARRGEPLSEGTEDSDRDEEAARRDARGWKGKTRARRREASVDAPGAEAQAHVTATTAAAAASGSGPRREEDEWTSEGGDTDDGDDDDDDDDDGSRSRRGQAGSSATGPEQWRRSRSEGYYGDPPDLPRGDRQLPSPSAEVRAMGMEGHDGWAWRGPVGRARLRDVTQYD